MKRLSESEVEKILKEQELWLKTGGTEGKHAYFFNVNLSGMDLSALNLQGAIFHNTCLKNADFRNANLRDVYFGNSDLTNVDFRGSDLTDVYFGSTDVDNAVYDKTTLPAMSCPEKGSFVGFKKAYGVRSLEKEYIVELRIPTDAKRSSATRNKCRCSKAKVLSITNLDGTKADVTEVWSWNDPIFIYRLGETVEVPDFDECRWHECTTGIHFFMEREDAVKW